METKQNFEVAISVRLHGAVTVEAWSREEAEEIVGERFRKGEIKLDELEAADETRIECVTDDDDEEFESGFFCPLHQRPCDQECSWAEKANCDYYQGLMAAK